MLNYKRIWLRTNSIGYVGIATALHLYKNKIIWLLHQPIEVDTFLEQLIPSSCSTHKLKLGERNMQVFFFFKMHCTVLSPLKLNHQWWLHCDVFYSDWALSHHQAFKTSPGSGPKDCIPQVLVSKHDKGHTMFSLWVFFNSFLCLDV